MLIEIQYHSVLNISITIHDTVGVSVSLRYVISVNGVFSEWGDWSNCTAACGLQCRHRKCDSPAPQNGGTDCTGHTLETRRCQPEHINCAGMWRSQCNDK